MFPFGVPKHISYGSLDRTNHLTYRKGTHGTDFVPGGTVDSRKLTFVNEKQEKRRSPVMKRRDNLFVFVGVTG